MIIHLLEHNGLNDAIIKKVKKNSNLKLYFGPLEVNLFAEIKGIYTELSFILDESFLSNYPSLMYIATPTTSLTHVDTKYCSSRGISIFSLKNKQELISNFTSTPEVAWWHLIELNRNCAKAQAAVVNGEWNRKDFFTNSFSNKNFGVIGFGRIGKRMAKIAQNFNMNVYAYDISPDVQNLNVSNVKFLNSIEEVFKLCNYVTVNIDDRSQNINLINKKLFDKIELNGTILVNTSRGFVLNSNDAIQALESGALGGLGIDVLPEEDNVNFKDEWRNNPIVKAKLVSNLNISITPHIGGATIDSLEIAAKAVFEEMCDFGLTDL
jgi:lactate dehydrogenase-like 2-hydroxyacid dehydrogenase